MSAARGLHDLSQSLTSNIVDSDTTTDNDRQDSWTTDVKNDERQHSWPTVPEKQVHRPASRCPAPDPAEEYMISMLKDGIAEAGVSELLRAMGSGDGAPPLLSLDLLHQYARVARCLSKAQVREGECPPDSVWMSIQRFDDSFREVFDGAAQDGFASVTADVEKGFTGNAGRLKLSLQAVRAEMEKQGTEGRSEGKGNGKSPAAIGTFSSSKSSWSQGKSKSSWSQDKLAMDRRSIFAFVLIIFVNSFAVGFRVFDCAWDKEEMKEFGWPLVIARGAAGGAVVCTTFLVMLMSRMVIQSFWQLLPRGRGISLIFQPVAWMLENHVKCHIVSGILLFVFAVAHTIAHLFGDLPNYAQYAEKKNGMMGKKTMAQLVMSRPGLTGVGMLVILCLITFTSRSKARASNFERFWTVHHSFLMYIVLLLCHAGSWLRPVWKEVSMKGLPLAWPVIPFLLLWIFERLRRHMRWREQGQLGGCEVTELTVSNSGSHVRLELVPPPHMTRHYNLMLRPGSYVMANVPAISGFQWHPFSVCSTSRTGRVVLLIANAGNWTGQLHKKCKQITEKTVVAQAGKSGKSYWQSYSGPASRSPEEGDCLDIRLDGCYLAPTAAALYGEHVVLVGGGVGVTPMMSVVDHEIMQLSQILTSRQRKERIRTVTFVWVTREFDDVVWIKHLLDRVREHAWRCELARFLRIRVFVTKKLKLETPAARLFWGAVRADSRARVAPEMVTEMGKLCLGRPDWESEFAEVARNKQQGARIQVYTCSNQAIADSVQLACGKNTYPNSVNFNFNKELFG